MAAEMTLMKSDTALEGGAGMEVSYKAACRESRKSWQAKAAKIAPTV